MVHAFVPILTAVITAIIFLILRYVEARDKSHQYNKAFTEFGDIFSAFLAAKTGEDISRVKPMCEAFAKKYVEQIDTAHYNHMISMIYYLWGWRVENLFPKQTKPL